MNERDSLTVPENVQEKYQMIFQHAPLGIYHVDREGYITACNRQLAEIMGTQPESIVGINVLNLNNQAYMEAVREAMTGRLCVFEGEYTSILGGKVVYLRVLFAPTGEGVDNQYEVVAIVENISERKEAEEKLRESEERWKFAVKNSGDGVWDWNIHEGTNQVSDGWVDMLGYQRHDVKEALDFFFECLHPEDTQAVESWLEQYQQGQDEEYWKTFRMKSKDGSYRWILSMGKIVSWTKTGNPLRAVGTHRDITEQKLAEEALLESERSKSVLLSNLPGMAYRCEHVQGKWQMSYISEGCYDLIGYMPDQLRQNDESLKTLILPEEIILPEYREPLWELWLQMMREKQEFRSEYRIRTADGSVKWVWERGRIITDDLGRVKALECFITDINERKVAEEKARQLDQLKDEFLANTSHELRTPLNGIITIVESLLKGIGGPLSEEQERNLQLVRTSGRRLSALVNDILDFSRIKHHDLRLHLRQVDLHSQVEIIMELLKNQAAGKHIHMVNKIKKECLPVLADENRLSQILFNLVGNALRYTEEGSIVITGRQQGDMMAITVADTGIGIPNNRLASLFEYYEQAGLSPEREYMGTGLGLPISRKLVELHGGTLEAVSKVGEGSAFTFTLPLATRVQRLDAPLPWTGHTMEAVDASDISHLIVEEETPVNMPAISPGEFTVLVVDDEPVNIQSLMNVLSLKGINVIPAISGEQALEVLEHEKPPDLCIVDIMMPRMNGFELCRQIRKRFTAFEVPVVFLTARYGEDDLRAGFASGGNDFLHKPFEEAELMARVETLLHLKKSIEKAMATEIAFLQAQIKPHFLYNALNTIAAYCDTESQKAGSLILSLSAFLRGSLSFDNLQDTIPLEQEMALTRAYADIELARFPKLRTIYSIETNRHVRLPPLTIQPLVENAIRHGICQKKEGGTVWVSLKDHDEGTEVLVEDDGIGADGDVLRAAINQGMCGKHVGLCNIQRRLTRMYGKGLQVDSEPGRGTRIWFVIPGSS